MRILVLLTCILTASFAAAAQNLIVNPGFELGPVPTAEFQITKATDWSSAWSPGSADLFDFTCSSTLPPQCQVDVPRNKWSVSRPAHSGNRYIGIGSQTVNSYGSSAVGKTTGPLAACTYTVGFWASGIDWVRPTTPTCCTQLGVPGQGNPWSTVQVVLRKSTNAALSKLVYATSQPVQFPAWQYFSGTFTLNAADALVGYDRVEFRLTPHLPPPLPGYFYHFVFLDDVVLQGPQTPCVASFALNASLNASGTLVVTATQTPLPTGYGYWWEVCELNLTTGGVVPGTTVTNPSAWWTYPNVDFTGYYATAVPPGFQPGHKYRVTYGVWSTCCTWATSSKQVFMRSDSKTAEITDDPSYRPPVPATPMPSSS